MGLILNIDTSLEDGSVSLSRNGVIISVKKNSSPKEHAAFLHPAVKVLLAEAGVNAGSLDAIAVTIGPGSYTGLRVGLAAAKGICYAIKKPLISVGTLNAMAKTVILQNDDSENLIYCPMIDARRAEVYTALYQADMKEILPAQAVILDPTSFAEKLKLNNILFFGNGSYKWKDICTYKSAMFFKNAEIFSAISLIAFEKFLAKDFADIGFTNPLYTKEFYIN